MKRLVSLCMMVFCFTALFAIEQVNGADQFTNARNFLLDPGFEQYAKSGKQSGKIRVDEHVSVSPWIATGQGFKIDKECTHGGKASICMENDNPKKTCGARQIVYFDKPVTGAIRFGGWSKALNVGSGDDFDVYLDIFYADGTPQWGVKASFTPGTHDWALSENIFVFRKPVKEIQYFVFLRRATGKAWFDDFFLQLIDAKVNSFRAMGGLFGPGSCSVSGAIHWMRQGTVPSVRIDPLPEQPNEFAPIVKRIENKGFLVHLDVKDKNGKPVRDCIASLCLTDGQGNEFYPCRVKAHLTPATKSVPFCLWQVPATKRVFLHSLPADDFNNLAIKDNSSRPVGEIELARNEYESFQLALISRRELKNIRFDWSDLTGIDNPSAKIDKKNIQWQQVGYIKADHISILPCDKEGAPGWWPDPLLPVSKGIAPAGKTVSFWFTVFAPKSTPAGRYRGTIVMTTDDGTATQVETVVRVRRFAIDSEGHLPTAFALMNGYLENVYKRPGDAKLRIDYAEFLLKHHLTPEGDISRTDLPVLAELEQYRGRGLGKFNIVNMVQDRGKSSWVCNSPASLYTPEFKRKMYEKIKPVVEGLRKSSLAKDAYIYTFDETKDEFYPIVKEFFGMVKESFPEVATFTTAKVPQDPKKLDELNIDWLCPVSSVYHYDEAEVCRAAGKKIWSYICCGPGHPFANIMCRFPLIESRILGWQSFEQKYDGFLYWGVNIWSGKTNVPFNPDDGLFLDWSIESVIGHEIYGDGRLLYANKNGQPIGCIRLAALRDGLEDYEYLYLLSQKLGSVDEARAWCKPVFMSPVEFTRDDDVLKKQRSKIADRIEQ
ncbi:MAG: DUF4091 domain-containing protein [Thermoguttaceae bacterium]|nr:DUF4091 domain-containing protein [Thermoguttaceae bacterium]